MTVEITFSANIEKVFSLLSDAEFLVDRALAIGELSAECTVEDDGKQVVIAMTREVERSLPSFLARLFDSRQTIELVERWKESRGRVRHGSLLITVSGQPVTIEAEMRLKPNAKGGCTYSIAHKVSASLPLIARRVEKFILSQVESGARHELEYLANTLPA